MAVSAEAWHDADVVGRLRDAYAEVDRDSCVPSLQDPSPHIPCASCLLEQSPVLRELFTVTLNLEVVLKRREADALVTARQKHLKWYDVIFHSLYGAYDIRALLRYWVKGIVVYEFGEIVTCISGAAGSTQTPPQQQQGVLKALDQAVELREGLRRLPRLVAFLFAGRLQVKEAQGFDELMKEVVVGSVDDEFKLHLLQRLLMEALRYRRQCTRGVVAFLRNSAALYNQQPQQQQQQRLRNSCVDICELIQLFSPDKRLAEERLVLTILQSVVDGCQQFLQREAPQSLLGPIASSDARYMFLTKTWPQYWHNELEIMRELPCMEEAWVKGILVKFVFLSDINSSSITAGDPTDGVLDLRHCYLRQLLGVTLRPLFDDLFGIGASGEEAGSPTTTAAEVDADAPITSTCSAAATRDSFDLLLDIANSMACVDVPPRRTLRFWAQMGAGAALPASIAKDVGYVVMAGVCRELLDERLTQAVDFFLLSGADMTEAQRWPRLLRYLLRTERVFDRLCEVWPLKMRLLDSSSSSSSSSSSNVVACFYSILEKALLRHRHRQRDVDVLIDSLVGGVHVYLLQGGREGAEIRRGGSPTAAAATGTLPLRSREEVRSAVRLARSVSSTDKLLRMYKELLAYRLLSRAAAAGARQRDGNTDAAEALREKLQTERSVCEYMLEVLPRERDAIRQMIQMCSDVEATNDVQEAYNQHLQQQQQQNSTGPPVKLTVRLLSRLVWPTYPTLPDVPRLLWEAMAHFAAFYEAQHRNRRVVWLRTSMETVTFTVAYPRGEKVITSVLELFRVFWRLSEAGGAGTTWQELAQHVGKDSAVLQRELRKLIADGFFEVRADGDGDGSSRNARVFLSADFASRQTCYGFLQPPPRVGALPAERSRIADELQQSRIAATQAAIVKQMKSVRACCYDELFRLTQQSVRQFQLQTGDFKAALERLIEKDYVERDPTQKQRFLYKA
ncbi:cullin-4B [Trypanosoma grayi]|uniref:cullin-4B n=1 Tax=Trypanosoma grayi TaxID=71804 RepID=UPI0004F498B7|nr:cullin-4B [Trypanosoma grayi]KEG08115.1 cullin-4B [Trypanosoma grayi]